jgi:RNA polymerase sigma-70 factor (ECF subfamily)
MDAPRFTPSDVARATSGDRAEMRRLLAAVLPIVRVRVARVLWRYRSLARKRDLQQEAEDLTHDVLLQLLEEEGRVLRTWDPARGLELLDFVGMVSDRTAAGVLKSGVRTPWREDPTEPTDLAATTVDATSSVDALASRELGQRILLALRAELSPIGARIFERLFVDEAEVEEICRELQMSRDAVYAWRSRLRRRLRELGDELTESAPGPAAARVS